MTAQLLHGWAATGVTIGFIVAIVIGTLWLIRWENKRGRNEKNDWETQVVTPKKTDRDTQVITPEEGDGAVVRKKWDRLKTVLGWTFAIALVSVSSTTYWWTIFPAIALVVLFEWARRRRKRAREASQPRWDVP
jgi:hypothetical protein